MIVFDQAWFFFLLPAPFVIRWLMPSYKTQRDALRAPFFKRLVELSGHEPGEGALILQRNHIQKIMIVLAWALLVIACADPQWVGEPIVKTQPSRSLMIAVDLSGSMEARDFEFDGRPLMDRLSGVKIVIDEFISRRENDRIGLIVFGSAPYLQIPFTLDHDLFKQLLMETHTRMAGPKTMLGDAIGLSVKHFSTSQTEKKVLILLTDGNDSGSLVPPVEAARVAADEGIVIHTIAIGDPSATGEDQLDLDALELISSTSGGVFFRATTGAQLSNIYEQLDVLEKVSVDVSTYRPKMPLYHWPVGILIVLQLMTQLAFSLSIFGNSRDSTSADEVAR